MLFQLSILGSFGSEEAARSGSKVAGKGYNVIVSIFVGNVATK